MVVIETRHSKIYCRKGVRFFATCRNYCDMEIVCYKQVTLWEPIFFTQDLGKIRFPPMDTVTDWNTGVTYLVREMWGDP